MKYKLGMNGSGNCAPRDQIIAMHRENLNAARRGGDRKTRQWWAPSTRMYSYVRERAHARFSIRRGAAKSTSSIHTHAGGGAYLPARKDGRRRHCQHHMCIANPQFANFMGDDQNTKRTEVSLYNHFQVGQSLVKRKEGIVSNR